MTRTAIAISQIIRDPEIQPRENMNQETITQYAEDMLAGIAFPDIVAYDDGEKLWLSQGFHRSRPLMKLEFSNSTPRFEREPARMRNGTLSVQTRNSIAPGNAELPVTKNVLSSSL